MLKILLAQFFKVRLFIRTFAKRNSLKISSLMMASKMITLAAVFAVFPMNPIRKDTKYQTNIKLDMTKLTPLVSPESQVYINSGLSRSDISAGTNVLDSKSVKALMQQLAPQYGIDWRLVYAIGYHESGNYNSSLARRQNNFFGRKASSGSYASWSTPEDGIRNQFEYLKTRYFDRGMDTPLEINPVYAEDMSWHYAIESVMNSL